MIPQHTYVYRARPIRVIDGDTLALCVSLGFGMAKLDDDNHFRVQGVNCPEVRGPTRGAGLAAKAFTMVWLGLPGPEDWPLIIQTQRLQSGEARTFERWVAAIYRVSDEHSLAEDLIAAGHGVASKG